MGPLVWPTKMTPRRDKPVAKRPEASSSLGGALCVAPWYRLRARPTPRGVVEKAGFRFLTTETASDNRDADLNLKRASPSSAPTVREVSTSKYAAKKYPEISQGDGANP